MLHVLTVIMPPVAPITRTRSTNVLGFPFIFRGALDVRATLHQRRNKIAAVHTISASLAKEPTGVRAPPLTGGISLEFWS